MKRLLNSVRALRIALGVSIALNLAVLGIVAGVAISHPPPGDPSRGFAFGPFNGALTPPERKQLREAFHREAPDMRESWKRMRGEFGAMQGILRADPYDPAAFAALLQSQQERGARVMSVAQKLIADHVAALSREDRIAFADRLEEQTRRRRE